MGILQSRTRTTKNYTRCSQKDNKKDNKMKKSVTAPIVAVVTLPLPIVLANYGSLFQHYALRKILRNLGFQTERYQTVGRTWPQIALRRLVYRCMLIRDILLRRRSAARHWSFMLRVEPGFIRFYRKYIGRLHGGTVRANAFVVGSDQVWSSLSSDVTLCEIGQGTKKVSYAASADWGAVAEGSAWSDTLKSVLERFEAISVRERYGMNLLKRLAPGVAVFHAIDPVFLLGASAFEKLISPPPPQ